MKVKIYALINTIDSRVFYIGCTAQDLNKRLSNHISRRTDCVKNRFVYNIYLDGGQVEILELDEVSFDNANFWEEFYIDLFLSFGFNLIQKRKSNYTNCKPLSRYRGKRYYGSVTNARA